MECGSFDGVEDDEYNGVGLVELDNIIAIQGDFFDINFAIWQRLNPYFAILT